MTCERIRGRLTAYLDGELEGDRGTVVRGHLRECAACRQIATDEAALRDGLRELPPVDPPPSLWAGVQARLAEAEVAEARRPAWRRALARWAPAAPRFAVGGLVAAAAVAVIWWRTHRDVDAGEPTTVASPSTRGVTRIQLEVASSGASAAPAADVTADLAGDPDRLAATYAETADELLALAAEARSAWTEEARRTFDARVGELRDAIDTADAGRARQRATQALIRYVQGAVVRDDVLLAATTPGAAP